VGAGAWGHDYLWGLPLVVLTVMFHVIGLSFIPRETRRNMPFICDYQVVSIGGVTVSITILHCVEVFAWAAVFLHLRAVDDKRAAVLYSLNAMTAYAHTTVQLDRQWQLMGALESLNGWILFGLSAAFLFVLIQRIWSGEGSRS